VRIRPSGWDGPDGSDSLIAGIRTRLDTLLDSSGVLIVDNFRPGAYTIEVESHSVGLRRELGTGGDLVFDTLKHQGGVAGQLSPAWKGSVRILGTDRIILTDSVGAFLRGQLPSGPVTLELRCDSGSTTRRARVRTVIPPEATADLGHVDLSTIDEESSSLWGKRARWTIDNTATGITRDVADFPLWVPLPDSVLQGMRPDASDLRVLDENGQFRPLEFASRSGVWTWMKRVDGSSKDHHLDVLWGRSDVASWSDPSSVFDSSAGWRGVWHFDAGTGCATAGCGAFTGSSSSDAGVVGSARRFDGNSFLRVSDSGTLEPSDLGVSLWVDVESIVGSQAQLVWKDSDGQSSLPSWGLLLRKSDGKTSVGFRARGGTSDSGIFAPISSNKWVHLAATIDRARAKAELFVDGLSAGTFPVDSVAPAPRHGDLRVGQGFVGRIDELRVSRIARAPAWFDLERANLQQTSKLLRP